MEQEFSALRKYIDSLIKKKLRYDGRKLEDYRKINIETNVISQANGSAKVTIGETQVIMGVKLDVGEPFPDSEDEGILMVSAEMTPIADPDFEPGPPRENAIELSRVVDRAIRESKVVDLKKLCIKKGEKVWMIFIDAVILNNDGNLFDACTLGAIAALKSATFPKYDKKTEKVDYREQTKEKIPLIEKRIPIMSTFVKIGNTLLIDPMSKEQDVSDAVIHIAMADGRICAMQKGGEDSFTEEEIYELVNKAEKYATKNKKLIK